MKTVGMMIKEILLERNISLSSLGRGLCKKSDLSRYLNGTRRIDRLLLTVFLQRIGKSPAKFSLLLTEEEYAYFEWKHKICLAQMRGDWKRVEQLLMENGKISSLFNEILQKQYAQIMWAIVSERVYNDREKCVHLLQDAISMTVPDFEKGIKGNMLLGRQEIFAILLWQNLQPDKEKSLKILEELVVYLERNGQDIQERVKVYPKVVAQYLKLLQAKKKYEVCLVLSENALNLMIQTSYASDMEIFLKIYIDAAENLGVEAKVGKRKRQLSAWQELMKDIGGAKHNRNDELFFLDVWEEIELLHEAVILSRREHNFSQEKLSENICEPETISRIENGKHIPHRSTYKAIAEKLALPTESYFTTIETDDFEVLEQQWGLEALIMRRNWTEAKIALGKLESMLNVEDNRNIQYIKEKQYSIERGLNLIPVGERLHQLISILQYTMPDVTEDAWDKDSFWEHYFRKTEMLVLIKVADVLVEMNQKERAAQLLEAILLYYKKSKINYDLNYRIVLLPIVRLTAIYSWLGNFDEVLLYVEEGIRIMNTHGNMRLLGGLINNKAHVLEELGHKEASLKYYGLAFYCADLMELISVDKSKCAYERIVGAPVEWY